MRKPFLILLAGFSPLAFAACSSFAAYPGAVVINEFAAATAGTTTEPDWVELYNQTESSIDLAGWILRDSTESNKKELSGKICPRSFRRFDFSNKLNKEADKIRIFDNFGNLIDVTSYPDQVPAHQQGQSSGRDPSGSSNWRVFASPSPTDVPCETPANTLAETSGNIILSEFMPNPESGEEWVEVHNPQSFEIDISSWRIDDVEGASSPFSIPEGTKISPQEYKVFFFSGKLNNSGDSIRLINQAGEVVEAYTFKETVKGASFAKDKVGHWQITITPTPGGPNIITKATTKQSQVAKSQVTKDPASSQDESQATTKEQSSNQQAVGHKPNLDPSSAGQVAGVTNKQQGNRNLAILLISAGLSFLLAAGVWPIIENKIWRKIN